MSAQPPDLPPERPDRPSEPVPPGASGPLPIDLVVPDDASSLYDDVLALRRELAAAQRRGRWARLNRHRPGLWSAPVALAALALVVVLGVLLNVYAPRPAAVGTPDGPVAVSSVPAGFIGGPLPRDTLSLRGQPVPSADLRTAVLALVPTGCTSCAAAMTALAGQAGGLGSPVLLVTTPAGARLGEALAAAGPPGAEEVIVDPQARLAAAYGTVPGQLSVVLVASNGLVTDVVHGFGSGQHLSLGYQISR